MPRPRASLEHAHATGVQAAGAVSPGHPVTSWGEQGIQQHPEVIICEVSLRFQKPVLGHGFMHMLKHGHKHVPKHVLEHVSQNRLCEPGSELLVVSCLVITLSVPAGHIAVQQVSQTRYLTGVSSLVGDIVLDTPWGVSSIYPGR